MAKLSERTRELMEQVDEKFDHLQLNFNEFRELLGTEEDSFDGPSAA